jgi:hypothetical protein
MAMDFTVQTITQLFASLFQIVVGLVSLNWI